MTIAGNSNTQYITPALPYTNEPSAALNGPGVLSVRARNATVAADVNTNSIIVIAPPQVQTMYATLIRP